MPEVLDSNAEDIAALDRLNRSEQSAAERERLRDAVIEAAKKWTAQTAEEYNTSNNPDLNELFEYERPLFAAVLALIDFEAKRQ